MLKNLRIGRLGVALAVAFGAVSFATPVAFAAPSVHRAAVIVETGSGTNRVVIEFTEDSITGIEALRRAGAEPVVYSYSGVGGAVCRLFGVGRDSGADCLGGTGGDARYWAYYRSPAGTSSFKYSSVGAGSTTVRDGDVEGWRFGTGGAPAFVSISTILGVETSTTTSTTAAPPSAPKDTSNTPSSGNGASITSTKPILGPSGLGSEPIDDATIGSEGASGALKGSQGPQGSSPKDRSMSGVPAAAVLKAPVKPSGSGPGSLVLLAVGLSGLAGCTIWARKARAKAASR